MATANVARSWRLKPQTFAYSHCCVDLSQAAVPALWRMIDEAQEVSYTTFRRRCTDLDQWAADQGYAPYPAQGLTLGQDWHVRYYRSRWRGCRCYYLDHSRIEHIWLPAP